MLTITLRGTHKSPSSKEKTARLRMITRKDLR